MRDLAYLKLLAKEYPTVKEATSEIVNLTAICSLPKGTEYFFSDLHGEYEAFIHLLRSSSGITREKIKETFGHLIPEEEQVQLANLIYYPERNLARMMKQGTTQRIGRKSPSTAWYKAARRCPPSTPVQKSAKRCRRNLPTSLTSCFMWTTTTITRNCTITKLYTPSLRMTRRTSSSLPCAI